MSLRFAFSSVMTLTILGSLIPFSPSTHAQSVLFICNSDNSDIPTTYAQTPDGDVPVFKWSSNYFRPPYTPAQRCVEVTERMNRFYEAGQLDYLTSGTVNRQPVICAGQSCNNNNVLVTLKPGQSASQVLQEIESNRSGAGGPSYQLGSSTRPPRSNSALSRNANGSVTLDMNRYLQNSTPAAVQSPKPPVNTTPGIVKPQNPSTTPRW